ncbi:MAG: M48 family metallopeptidase [Desulfobacterales bacterium]|nr:M48 family metallopeptidase [Desulfobacterales bacterium]
MNIPENLITLTILTALIGGYLLEALADALNLGRLTPNLPKEFSDTYDAKVYAASQEYLKTTTRFGLLTNSLNLVLVLAFWFLHGFEYLDLLVRGLGYGPVVTGILFIGGLTALRFILGLPFKVYSTFVIEERFGFNTVTPSLFIKDLLKGMGLGTLIGIPFLGMILWLFQTLGTQAWLYGWGVTLVFTLAMQYLIPTWIMPLFNRFSPIEEGELKEAIMAYARKINFPLTQVFVMDGSKRSTKSNAFFTGFGKNKRIVLFDTLIQNHTTQELVGVLAHEMGHYKKKHIQTRLAMGAVHTGVIFFLLSLCLSMKSLFSAFFVTTPSVYAGLIFFSLLMSPVDMVVSLGIQALSRKDEYEADRYAARTLGTGEHLIKALKKLSVHNLSNLTPHPLYVMLNYSHPPVIDRIRALDQLTPAQKQGAEA